MLAVLSRLLETIGRSLAALLTLSAHALGSDVLYASAGKMLAALGWLLDSAGTSREFDGTPESQSSDIAS